MRQRHESSAPPFKQAVCQSCAAWWTRVTYHDSCTTIFPSITPAATTAIITGEYPAANGIVGASWFDAGSQDVAYYGDDFWVIAREGFRRFSTTSWCGSMAIV